MNKRTAGVMFCLIAGGTVCNKVYCSSFIYVRRFILERNDFCGGT